MSASKSMLKSTLAVTVVIFISKAIGLVREMIMANYFGAGLEMDAYNSAYSLFYMPVLLFSSCITSTLMPEYLKCDRELGRAGSDRFGSNAINLFALFALLISALMFIGAGALVSVVYPGFIGDKFSLTVELTQVMMPALVFFVIALALSSLLNAREKFVQAQLTGFPLSVAMITAAIFFSEKYGIRAQAWSIIAAGVGQVIILFPCLGGSFSYKPVFDIKDKHFRNLALLAAPAMLSMAVNELNHMIDRMLASTLNNGDISAMSYAFKLIMFMMGVLVVPLTTVSFSKLSNSSIDSNRDEMRKQVRDSIRLLLAAILPIVIIAACASKQIIRFAYCRGAFTEENVVVTGTVFMFYVIGVPFFGLRDLMNRVFHSLSDTKTPMRIAMASMALNVCFNLILRKLMGVNGLALATGIAALAGVCQLVWRLNRLLPGVFTGKFIFELLRVAAASVPVLICALLMSRLLPDAFGLGSLFIWLAGVTACSLAVYAVTSAVLGGINIKTILRRLLKR